MALVPPPPPSPFIESQVVVMTDAPQSPKLGDKVGDGGGKLGEGGGSGSGSSGGDKIGGCGGTLSTFPATKRDDARKTIAMPRHEVRICGTAAAIALFSRHAVAPYELDDVLMRVDSESSVSVRRSSSSACHVATTWRVSGVDMTRTAGLVLVDAELSGPKDRVLVLRVSRPPPPVAAPTPRPCDDAADSLARPAARYLDTSVPIRAEIMREYREMMQALMTGSVGPMMPPPPQKLGDARRPVAGNASPTVDVMPQTESVFNVWKRARTKAMAAVAEEKKARVDVLKAIVATPLPDAASTL